MRRGQIHLIDFEPTQGSEANKRRPAVIVSNDRANASAQRLGRGVVTVVPLTSSVRTVYPFQVLLRSASTGLRVDSKAQGRADSLLNFGLADRPRAGRGGTWGYGTARRRDQTAPRALARLSNHQPSSHTSTMSGTIAIARRQVHSSPRARG